ncbi:MAG: putative HTH-type transcriptional regulator yxbF [Frankiales bacterium]|nr:putative HTH-type transcriptional regulator yxbF [Frankiales bacterium]
MSISGERTPDRRQRKSRAALQQGLLALIATKPYDAITIEDITAAADVARATFYAHYRDKTELLDEASAELIADLTARVYRIAPARATSEFRGAGVVEVFRHAGEHRDLYLLVLTGAGGARVRADLIRAFEAVTGDVLARMIDEPGRTPRESMIVTTKAFVGAVLLTLEYWLAQDRRPAAAEVANEMLRAQVGGLEWALGFAPGETGFDVTPTPVAGSGAG